MPYWWYKLEDYRPDYKVAYRLWRWMQGVRGGVITGLPGTKKTLRTLLAVTAFNKDRPVVFAFPLRQLRDEVVGRFDRMPLQDYKDRITVVRAHDEVCPALAKRLKEGMSYWRALAEHLRAVKEKREDCNWKNEVKKAMDAIKANKVILTTHGIAIMLWLVNWVVQREDTIFIFDEGDEIFVNVNDPIHVKDLEPLKELAPSKYKRIVRLTITPTQFKEEKKTALFLKSRILFNLILHSFFITATWPKSVSEWFNWYEGKTIEVYPMKAKKTDDITVMLTEPLNWKDRSRWMPVLAPQLIEIATAAVEKFGTVGVIARSYEQNRELINLFTSSGFTVWSDYLGERNEYDYRDADVVILTVLGKGYRGVNFFSKRTGADFPVILGFYQAHGPNIMHPLFRMMFEDNPDDPHSEMTYFIKDLVMAKNVQALFRFNRYRSRKHLMILLDKRWWSALHAYVANYYRNTVVVNVNIEDVAKVAVPLIKTLNPDSN